ncbi:MAG: hypothetical protein PT120_05675 [Aphanizomenon gracile PMC649.10]|nr:hypothetical protein [Aphanizomenon gracile PMC649.10]
MKLQSMVFNTVADFSESVVGSADLYIEITNMNNADAGTYDDTLTLTVPLVFKPLILGLT